MIIGQRIRYAWHLRVPIVGLFVLGGLPIFSFSAGLKPFLGGLFDPLSERCRAWFNACETSERQKYGIDSFTFPASSMNSV